ncbi:slipin family protein [Gaopeijia maritima]|uniref:Slipin family protein n=1 Tax=Gaopeijia maritima TaxID=3119007 RepID=A0ABU9EBJ8_9BACT
MDLGTLLIPAGVLGVVTVLSSLRLLYEYQRGVVFRLGKLVRARGPGLIWLLPFGIERMRKMDLRIVALDIPPQDTITKDNVSVTVNAVVYFRVADPSKAVVEIEDYYFATSQLAQTTLRSVIGQSELDELLADRDRINDVVRTIIDQGTDSWGVEVTSVEIKDIGLPQEMKRAMARQAEAERERRAKVISADGEYQASAKLALAADVIRAHPAALQLRFLQTVVEIAAENNSTTLFPIPIDMFAPFLEKATGVKRGGFPSSDEGEGEGGSPRLALPDGAAREELAEAARAALGLGETPRREKEPVAGEPPRVDDGATED